MKIKLSVITVTYNSQRFIKDYLKSLTKILPEESEILLIDSGSGDQTVEEVEKYIKEVNQKNIKLTKIKDNIGFGKGCNLGSKNALGEYLFFLNPDTKIISGSFEKLLVYIKNDDSTGIIAPKLVEPDGKVQKSVRKSPSLKGVVLEYIFNQKNAYTEYAPSSDQPVEEEAVVGGAMLIKRDLFLEVGGFDEKYFMYYEDFDLCRKIKKLGKKIIYYPFLVVEHEVGGSIVPESKLPIGIRTLAWFYPIKSTGKNYYIVKSLAIYHGVLVSFLISLIIYIRTRLLKKLV